MRSTFQGSNTVGEKLPVRRFSPYLLLLPSPLPPSFPSSLLLEALQPQEWRRGRQKKKKRCVTRLLFCVAFFQTPNKLT